LQIERWIIEDRMIKDVEEIEPMVNLTLSVIFVSFNNDISRLQRLSPRSTFRP
jgi:hypothetical protein